MNPYPWELVAPSTHPFDRDVARTLVQTAMGPKRERVFQDDLGGLNVKQLEVERALLVGVGVWVTGWNSGDGGGPVHMSDRKITWGRVFKVLCEWRAFLEELEARFQALHAELAQRPLHQEVETAAGRLLPFIVERTRAREAWQHTLTTVLRWYLEFIGAGDQAIVVKEVCSGYFHSDMTPREQHARDGCAALGTAVANPTAEPRDALEAWTRLRPNANWSGFAKRHTPTRQDGHRLAIDRWDAKRDERRAAQLHAALTLTRDSAHRGQALSFDLLAELQGIVTGASEVGRFRTGVAWARGRRERYGLTSQTQQQFEDCLDQANDPSTHLVVRAANVFLDLCFFHPFDDGNGRLARLALDHVLTREGYALRVAEPIFLLGRVPEETWGFLQLLDLLMAPMAKKKARR